MVFRILSFDDWFSIKRCDSYFRNHGIYGIHNSNAEIQIKSDGPCPNDGIIASGFTDKKGKYRIYSITKVWDASDNLIRVQAHFAGNEIYSPTISERSQIIIVYPTSTTEKCVNE